VPRHDWENEEPDDDGPDWDDEQPDEDPAEDDEEPTVACPWCKRQVHEDAQRCPYCEQYLSDEDAPRAGKPWWIVLGVLACLYDGYRWIAG